jgi:hypothetical protein
VQRNAPNTIFQRRNKQEKIIVNHGIGFGFKIIIALHKLVSCAISWYPVLAIYFKATSEEGRLEGSKARVKASIHTRLLFSNISILNRLPNSLSTTEITTFDQHPK